MLYRPRNLGGNLRRVKHSGQCGTFFITSIRIFAFIHSMLLRQAAKCLNCPVSSRRKCWIVTCLIMVRAGIKTSATGDRNKGRRGSSNCPFQIMLQNNSSLFSKPKAVNLPNISVNRLHSPHPPITQFCWRSPLQHSDELMAFSNTH